MRYSYNYFFFFILIYMKIELSIIYITRKIKYLKKYYMKTKRRTILLYKYKLYTNT